MIIKSVVINNFKNFTGENNFNLNKGINILYAENGFGKSSFFDAIEWCLTGKISRFDEFEKFKDEDVINYNVKEENHTCSVEIEFDTGKLTRIFKIKNFKKSGRKSVRVKYLNEDGKFEVKNSEKYIDIILNKNNLKKEQSLGKIKQTHILSQDQITEFINKEDPKKRYKSLLSIMGIENATNISNNLKGINRELSKNLEKIDLDIEKADIYISNLNESKEEVCDKLVCNKLNELHGLFKNHTSFKEKQYDEFISLNPKEEVQNSINLKKLDSINKIDKLKKLKDIGLKTINELKKEINDTEIKIKKEKKLNDNIKEKCKKLDENLSNIEKNKNDIEQIKKLKINLEAKENEIKDLDIQHLRMEDRVKLNIDYEKYIYAEKNKIIMEGFTQEKNNIGEEIKLKITEIENNKNNLKEKQQVLNNIKLSIDNTDTKEIIGLLDNIEDIGDYVKDKKIEVCPVCSSNLGENLYAVILNNIFDIKLNLEKINEVNKKYLQKKDSLNVEIKILEDNISKSEKYLAQLNIRKKIADTNYTNILINGLYSDEVFSKSHDELKIKVKNIKSSLEKIKRYEDLNFEIKTININYEEKLKLLEYKEEYKDLESTIKNIKKELEEKTIEILNRNKLIKEYQKKLDEYKFVFANISTVNIKEDEDIDLISKKTSKEIAELNEKSKHIEEMYEYIYKLKRNKEQDIKIKKHLIEKDNFTKISKKIEQKIKENEKYINEIIKYSDEYIDEYINRDDSPIKQYYRYLNPMPNKQYLYFESIDEKLTIKLKCSEDGKIMRLANKTLSSGQLNVLALSIFLAMSEHQKINDLELIAIDDPIQNMDDVNQFSVCDILGNLKKQLVFSTHDIEFVKLFLKKNMHRKDDITVFTFKSPYLNSDNIKEITFNKKSDL